MEDVGVTSRPLVLIADDYDHTAQLTAELIELNSRYETMTAMDGMAALKLAVLRPPDAAILDIDMPRLNGTETARALRSTYPDRKMLIIAATGGLDADLARASGLFDEVLIKPYDFDELLRLLGGMCAE